jgi:hypothetical protein
LTQPCIGKSVACGDQSRDIVTVQQCYRCFGGAIANRPAVDTVAETPPS